MNLAVLSVAALVVAIIVSCVTTLNVGVLSLALAWIIGVYVGHMPINTVIAGFPTSLFLTLTGMTLLFSLAQCNGTLDRLAHHAVRSCRGNRGMIPIIFFVLAFGLGSMGPGNIATAMNIGGHLVDISPLSTIGALCIAGAAADETRPLFNKLLAWGLSMSVLGAVLCYVLFL
jgi:dicarboxylate carrier protein MatC